jgi:hypothetical protein
MDIESRHSNIIDYLSNEPVDDAMFNSEKLTLNSYLNFQIDDCYNFIGETKGRTRTIILESLFNTFNIWRQELVKLHIPFYLAVWIYEPRLPKSEVVCAIDNKIDYYRTKVFDQAPNQNNYPGYELFEPYRENLSWSKKIDYDYLEEWEVNFPKEQYENLEEWEKDQKRYKSIMADPDKIIEGEKGKTFCTIIGKVWVGENRNEE